MRDFMTLLRGFRARAWHAMVDRTGSPSRRVERRASAGGCRRGMRLRPARGRDKRADPVHGREPDETVDDAAGRVRLAELHAAEDPGDEVEFGHCDESPVE